MTEVANPVSFVAAARAHSPCGAVTIARGRAHAEGLGERVFDGDAANLHAGPLAAREECDADATSDVTCTPTTR